MKSFLPLNLGLPATSRIAPGKTWPAAKPGKRVRTFQVYRFDPDSAGGPRLDTYSVDRGDC